MGCLKCDMIQDGSTAVTGDCFVRVGRANILIVGCDEHLKELIAKLRATTPTPPQQEKP